MALGTYDALKRLGLRIPEEVGFMGFDNQKIFSEQHLPPVSTMALPHSDMGRWAVETLLSKKLEPKHYMLPCPFIERASIRRIQL